MRPILAHNILKVSLASLNIKGLGRKDKRDATRLLMRQRDIIALQEAHGSNKTQFKLESSFPGYKCYWSHYKSNSRGVAILVNKLLPSRLFHKDNAGRLVAVEVGDGKDKILIVNVYAPVHERTISYKKAYSELIQCANDCLTTSSATHKLICGDWNTTWQPGTDAESDAVKPHPHPKQLIEQLTAEHDLVNVFRAACPEKREVSYVPFGKTNENVARLLDHAFATPDLTNEIRKVEYSFNHLSDHKTLELQTKAVTRQPKAKLWRHKDDMLYDDLYRNAMEERIVEITSSTALTELSDNRSKWEYIKYEIRREAKRQEKAFHDRRNQQREECRKVLKDIVPRKSNLPAIRKAKLKLDLLEATHAKQIIAAAKVEWAEQNEKATSFFFNRIKHNADQCKLSHLQVGGETLTKPKDIQEEIHRHYSEIYAPKLTDSPNERWKETMNELPKISEAQKKGLDRPISEGELGNTLFKHMKEGKSPGNDGLTVLLYRTYWLKLKKFLHAAYLEARQEGMLSPSQRQTIIRLIPKKGKDVQQLKNWRPISLINVDTKIISRAVTERTKKVLGDLISPEQLGFMKGRLITEGNQLIEMLLKDKNNPSTGEIVSIDFAKAFDSVSHEYLIETLKQMNFPSEFIETFKLLYNKAESAVINDKETTRYFPLGRGARQGDPWSPYLFILGLEPLIRHIKNSNTQGLRTPQSRSKLTAYADDITLFAKDQADREKYLDIIKEFGKISGLNINEEKTNIITLDPLDDRTMTVTGIVHGGAGAGEEVKEKQFEPIVTKITNIIRLWKSRYLSTMGRAQVIKTQALSCLNYPMQIHSMPERLKKKLTTEIYNFLWKGPDKIPREDVSLDISQGGLKLPTISDIETASKTQWWARRSKSTHPWTEFIDDEACRLACTADRKGWNDKKAGNPPHNAKVADMVAVTRKLQHDLTGSKIYGDEQLHRNPNALDRNLKPLLLPGLHKAGLDTPNTILMSNGEAIGTTTAMEKGLPPRLMLEWAHAAEWLDKNKRLLEGIQPKEVPLNGEGRPITRAIQATKGQIELSNLTFSETVKILRGARNETSRATKTHADMWNIEIEQIEHVRKAIKWVGPDTRIKDFLFRLTKGLLYSNYKLFKAGIKDSAACTWCDEEKQTLPHMLGGCHATRHLVDKHWAEPMDTTSRVRHTRLLQYIYSCNFSGDVPSQEEFEATLAFHKETDRIISSRRGTMRGYERRWGRNKKHESVITAEARSQNEALTGAKNPSQITPPQGGPPD